MKRRLNWLPSLPSHKDIAYKLVEPTSDVLPESVDLRPLDCPIFDQLDIGSCSGNALAGAVGFLELQELKAKIPPGLAPQEYTPNYIPVSRLQIYWNERLTEGTTNQDAGATTIRDGADALLNKGVCAESSWPYLDENVLKEPTAESFNEALSHRISCYYTLETLEDMKRCLYHGYPFTIGFTVYDSFMSEEVAQTGIMPIPGPNEQCQGGHAVLCVGYDDKNQWFIIRNSWGTNWGQQGYVMMPYSVALNARDFFTIRRMPGGI